MTRFNELQPQKLQDVLTEEDVYMYTGHGNGYKAIKDVLKREHKSAPLKFSSNIFLFGCKSLGWENG